MFVSLRELPSVQLAAKKREETERRFRTMADCSPGANTRLVPPLRIEAGTAIGEDCTVGPDVYIERDCRIGDGVTIRNAVLLRGSAVPDGATIADRGVAQ